MRVAVALMVAEILHELRGCISEMHRNRPGAVFLHEGAHGVEGRIDGVALGRAGEIDRRLCERELALGRAETFVRFCRLYRKLRAFRIRQ